MARRPRPGGRRRRHRPGRLLLRRLPARRRDRALLAGDGAGGRVRARRAARCSGSATASRCCARRGCCRARCCPTPSLRFVCRQVDVRGRERRHAVHARVRAAARRCRCRSSTRSGAASRPHDELDELERNGQLAAALRAGSEPERLRCATSPASRTRQATCFGLMPHPEHAVDALTGSTDGARSSGSLAEHCLRRVDRRAGRRRSVDAGARARPDGARSSIASASCSAASRTRSSWRSSRCCGRSTAPTSTRRSCCASCPPRASGC